MSRAAGLVLLGLMLTAAGSGGARGRSAPKPVVLDYRRLAGAEACPTRAQLEAQVTEILGHRAFAQRARRKVRCVLRGQGETLGARVQLLDVPSGRVLGVRELSSTAGGCEELGGAVALAIALAIDPLARPPPVQPKVSRAPAAAPSTAPIAGGLAAAGGKGSTTAAAPTAPTPRSAVPGPRLVPDAGSLGPASLVPLLAVLGPDAGPGIPDAGVPPAPPDAGAAHLDAGMAPDAGPLPVPVDAGVPAADAGPEPPVPDAGTPAPGEEPTVVAAAPATGWRPVAGVEALGAAGVLPGFAGGAGVHAGAASETASVEAELRWLPGTRLAFGPGSISTSLWSGALVGCARFGPWAACGLTQAGPLHARGEGYSRSQEASAWMVSVGARAQWEWMFSAQVGLRLHLDGAANLVRPRLLIDAQEAWSTPPVSVWVGGGLLGRF